MKKKKTVPLLPIIAIIWGLALLFFVYKTFFPTQMEPPKHPDQHQKMNDKSSPPQ